MKKDLTGKRIMVVEDDYLLAHDICENLSELGATVLGPAPTPFYARLLMNRNRLDAAVLDVSLHGTTVFDVADTLVENGVPFVFATAYESKSLPRRFRDALVLTKPYSPIELIDAVQGLLREPHLRSQIVVSPKNGEKPVVQFARAVASTLR